MILEFFSREWEDVWVCGIWFYSGDKSALLIFNVRCDVYLPEYERGHIIKCVYVT